MSPVSSPKPLITPLPNSYAESFPPDQSERGNATWCTLCSSQLAAGIASCPPKGSLALHRHTQPELYHILSGSGIVEIEGTQHEAKEGTTIFIPGDAEHGVYNLRTTDFRWLYVFPGKFEDVLYRFRHEGAYGGGKLKSKL